MHGGAVEDHRQPDGPVLQDLGGQLQARVQLGVTPAQPDVAGRREPQGVLPRVPAMPDHALGVQRGPHPLLVVARRVVDLVADHVQLGGDPPGGQQAGQLGHLQRVPARRELAGVDQPQRRPGRGRVPGRGDLGQDGRQQYALAARRGDAALQEAAQFLGLAEHVARGGGDHREFLGRRRREPGHRLRDVGQVRPQPPGERAALGRRGGDRPAAQHDQVVRGLGVQPGEQLRGRRGGDRTWAFEQVFLERPADRHARFGQQRRDQAAGADRCLEHQRYRAACPGQRLRDGLQPDGRAIDQVQVYVTVDKRARGHATTP